MVFVVDATVGATDADEQIVRVLRQAKVPVILVANKVDDERAELEATRLWSLGLGEPYTVSALHGRGSGDLLDVVLAALPEEGSGQARPRGPHRVALLGKPNVGKSSLLNAIAGTERALVDSVAGTTRDPIDEELEFGGEIWRFIDTAGIREGAEEIEALGIERSFEKIEQASIVLCLADASDRKSVEEVKNWQAELEQNNPDKKILLIANKIDLDSHLNEELSISAKNGIGIDSLKQKLVDLVIGSFDIQNETIVSNARHYEALMKTSEALEKVSIDLENGTTGDFIALDIRAAMRSLGNITGEIEIDRDILGTIFERFCIGK